MTRVTRAVLYPLIVASLLVLFGATGGAFADDCLALTGSPPGVECVLSSAVSASGPFNIAETLHITGSGSITIPPAAGGNTLTLTITGSLIMDAGALIIGDVNGASATGATIIVSATGDIDLAGGAQITSNQSGGSCSGGAGGNITLSASGNVDLDPGSVVSANAKCSAGAIVIGGQTIDIDGLVQSKSTLTGTGAKQRPGGGPITIDAACDLTISDDGKVSSQGSDPGADLVHLAGGCSVLIDGLVESTGPGHAVPNSPANHCGPTNRPGKPANSTACIEVWSGGPVAIDSTGTHKGELNADTAQSGGHQIAWIDVYALGDIAIIDGAGNNHPVPLPGGFGPFSTFAIHANEFVTNADGGLITVKSKNGKVTMSGNAIQANATTAGGAGGSVDVEAGGTVSGDWDVDFSSASVQAEGANVGGGHQKGGTIFGRSFNGQVLGVSPGELNADGGGGHTPPKPGSVTLQGCGPTAAQDGVAYTGASTPAATILADSCSQIISIPGFVKFPACACAQQCQ